MLQWDLVLYYSYSAGLYEIAVRLSDAPEHSTVKAGVHGTTVLFTTRIQVYVPLGALVL